MQFRRKKIGAGKHDIVHGDGSAVIVYGASRLGAAKGRAGRHIIAAEFFPIQVEYYAVIDDMPDRDVQWDANPIGGHDKFRPEIECGGPLA